MSSAHRSLRTLLDRPVDVRPVVQMLLAVVIIAGGLALAALALFALFFVRPPAPYPHPVGAFLLFVVMAAMGTGFLWIGFRLIGADSASSNLLSPLARRRCGVIVGVLAVVMLLAAVEAGSIQDLVAGGGCAVIAYYLFPIKRR